VARRKRGCGRIRGCVRARVDPAGACGGHERAEGAGGCPSGCSAGWRRRLRQSRIRFNRHPPRGTHRSTRGELGERDAPCLRDARARPARRGGSVPRAIPRDGRGERPGGFFTLAASAFKGEQLSKLSAGPVDGVGGVGGRRSRRRRARVWTRCGSRRTRRVRSPCGAHPPPETSSAGPESPQLPTDLLQEGGGRGMIDLLEGAPAGSNKAPISSTNTLSTPPTPPVSGLRARRGGVAGSPSPPPGGPGADDPRRQNFRPPPTRTRTTHRSLARAWSAASPSRACSGGTSRSPRRRSSRGTRRRRRRRSE
jgi:hypothetical protein